MTSTATLAPTGRNLTFTATLRFTRFVVIAAALAIVYHAIGAMLLQRGVIASDLAFFGEKAALALHGAPPRLVNIGFVYPPLSFLLQLPFGDPLLAQAVIGGLAIAAVVDFLITRLKDVFLRVVAVAFVLCSPVMLYLAVQDYSALLFCLLLAASIRYALRFLENGYSLHLFLASTLLGLTFFVDFRSVILLPVVAPALALPLWRRAGVAYAVSIALTVCVPMIFFALAWAYVNWTFLGDPLAFVYGRGSFFRAITAPPEMLAVAGLPFASVAQAATVFFMTLPITLPYVVGLVWIRRAVPTFPVAAAFIYATPIALLVSSIYGGSFRPEIALTGVCLFIFLFLIDQLRPNRIIIGAAMAIAFAASCVAPAISPDRNERAFADALRGHATADTLAPYRDVVAHVAQAKRILVDDTSSYQLVYLAENPRRFVLPYQYEYASALSNPRAFVDAVIVGRRSDDEIAALYPATERGALRGFHEVFRNAAFIVFARESRT